MLTIKKLPNITFRNTTTFKDWMTHIENEIYQYLSTYGVTHMGYIFIEGNYLFFVTHSPYRYKKTNGWEILIKWANGTVTCRTLSAINELLPMNVLNYKKANAIVE